MTCLCSYQCIFAGRTEGGGGQKMHQKPEKDIQQHNRHSHYVYVQKIINKMQGETNKA